MTIIGSSEEDKYDKADDADEDIVMELIIDLPQLFPFIALDRERLVDGGGSSEVVIDVLSHEVTGQDAQYHHFRWAYVDTRSFVYFW